MDNVMPKEFPLALPSNTEMMTPRVSIKSDTSSVLVGTFLSTNTATAATTTGIDALHPSSKNSCALPGKHYPCCLANTGSALPRDETIYKAPHKTVYLASRSTYLPKQLYCLTSKVTDAKGSKAA